MLSLVGGHNPLNSGFMVPVFISEFTPTLPTTLVRSYVIPGVTLPDNTDTMGGLSTSLDGGSVIFTAFTSPVGVSTTLGCAGPSVVVSLNRWGASQLRVFSLPAVLGMEAVTPLSAVSCDVTSPSKFFIGTTQGRIYSSPFPGAPLSLETNNLGGTPVSALACTFPNSSAMATLTPRLYSTSCTSGGVCYTTLPPSSSLPLSSSTSTNVPITSPGTNIRGFFVANYSKFPFVTENVWTVEYSAGVSFNARASPGVPLPFFRSTKTPLPGGTPSLGLASLPSLPGRLWVVSSGGVYLLDTTTPTGCSTTVNAASCTWLNSSAPILSPSKNSAFRGIAAVPSSLSTSTPSTPFTPGNLLAVRVGNGYSPLSTLPSSAPVYLEEYTTSGVLVQTLQLTGGLINASIPFYLSGLSLPNTPEGLMALSNSGYFASLAAFDRVTATGMVARIQGSSIIDATTHFTPSKSELSNVSSAVFANSGDIAFVCRVVGVKGEIAGIFTGWGGNSSSEAGYVSSSSSTTPSSFSSCTYALFQGKECGTGGGVVNTLWVAVGGKYIASATVVSPMALTATLFLPAPGLSGFTDIRQFIFSSASSMYVADYGMGIKGFTLFPGYLTWTLTSTLTPCATLSFTGGCAIVDVAVIGVAISPIHSLNYLFISTSTAIYRVNVTNSSSVTPTSTFTPIVLSRVWKQLRGLSAVPLPPSNAILPTPFSLNTRPGGGSALILRAEDAVSGGASRLFLDEVDTITSTSLQTWLLPYSSQGMRATLFSGGGYSSLINGPGGLSITPDGGYLVFGALDVGVGTTGPALLSSTSGWGHTAVRVSCRGTVAFSLSSNVSQEVWQGLVGLSGSSNSPAADASPYYVAKNGAGLSYFPGLGASNTSSTVVLPGSFLGLSLLTDTTYPTSGIVNLVAWGFVSGALQVFLATAIPTAVGSVSGSSFTVLSTLAFSDSYKINGLGCGAASSSIVVPLELWCTTQPLLTQTYESTALGGVTPSETSGWVISTYTDATNTFSRGALWPVESSTLSFPVNHVFPVNTPAGRASGSVYLTSSRSAWKCAPFSCGPGPTAFTLTTTGFFRTSPGSVMGTTSQCNVSVALVAGFLASVTYTEVGLGAGDSLVVYGNASSTLLSTASPFSSTNITSSDSTLLMHLSTDSTYTSSETGIIGNVFAYPYTCGGGSGSYSMMATSLTPFALYTPGKTLVSQTTSQYATLQRCDFLVTPSAPGESLSLNFSSRTSIGTGALITVHNGPSPRNSILFRGAIAPGSSLQVPGNGGAYVTFTTPEGLVSGENAAGIVATVSSSPYSSPVYLGTTSCPNTLFVSTSTSGITAPSWQYRTQAGNFYGNCYSTGSNTCTASLSCSTLVTAPPGYTVNFTIVSFDTEVNGDWFTWYDGSNVNR